MEETSDKELSQEELKAIEDAAFAAEMSGEAVDVKAPEQPQIVEQKQEQEATEPQLKETQPERQEVIPGFTLDELTQMRNDIAHLREQLPKIQKSVDSTSGTVGKKLVMFQDALDRLNSQPETSSSTAEQKLSRQAELRRLKEAYPEMAELLSQDLNEIITSGGDSATGDIDALRATIETAMNERISQIEQRNALQRLKDRHPDYAVAAFTQRHQDDDPRKPALIQFSDMQFGNWIAQQSRDIQTIVLNSNDPDELSGVLDSYKQSLVKPEQKDDKRRALERSVQPRGVKSTSIGKSDKELEDEAFRAEMAS